MRLLLCWVFYSTFHTWSTLANIFQISKTSYQTWILYWEVLHLETTSFYGKHTIVLQGNAPFEAVIWETGDVILNTRNSAQTKFRAKHPHRPKKKRRGRPPKASVVDDTKVHHYTAYVPIGGYIWELDGMKRYPIKVAPIPEGQSWVETVKPLLRKQMLQS